jgi:hypothetical protein
MPEFQPNAVRLTRVAATAADAASSSLPPELKPATSPLHLVCNGAIAELAPETLRIITPRNTQESANTGVSRVL